MEAFLDKICTEHKIPLRGVLYLGAEWCQEASMFEKHNADFVFWVEAQYNNIMIAGHHYLSKLKHPQRHSIANYAITDKDGETVEFFIYNEPAASSIFEKHPDNKWYPLHKVESSIEVTTITVDSLLKQAGVNNNTINLLCMDLQGAELLAIDGAYHLLQSPALQYICCEVVSQPLYAGGCLESQVNKALAWHGFEPVEEEYHTPTHPGVESVPQKDVLYKKVSS